MSLFDVDLRGRSLGVTPEIRAAASWLDTVPPACAASRVMVSDRVLEVYARARNPDDPVELRDLWLGRVELELGSAGQRVELADRWRSSVVRRQVGPADVLNARATVRFVKELFNWYFRDDLYGALRPDAQYILSGGAVDEQVWGLPEALKECVRYALDRDWYGYSDSRGREPVREAVARYENVRIDGAPYDTGNVALTMGGTFAISALADFILLDVPGTGSPALCGIPNYPPLVEAIARRHATQLVPLPQEHGFTSVDALIAALQPDTPLVMLQTVANPTGAVVAEADLERLIRAATPTTMILFDECHEWLGPPLHRSSLRSAPNVVRVASLSKTWSVPGLKVGWILAERRFIDAYYEYASTTFGGPPSFLYTMVEVLARMERWLLTGRTSVGPAEVAEFEASYELRADTLDRAFRTYRHDRVARDEELSLTRDATVVGLARASAVVHRPRYSINIAAEFPAQNDSYLCFREILRRTGVSVFPGILTFGLAGADVRVTTARPWSDLAPALERLRTALVH